MFVFIYQSIGLCLRLCLHFNKFYIPCSQMPNEIVAYCTHRHTHTVQQCEANITDCAKNCTEFYLSIFNLLNHCLQSDRQSYAMKSICILTHYIQCPYRVKRFSKWFLFNDENSFNCTQSHSFNRSFLRIRICNGLQCNIEIIRILLWPI